MAADVAGTITKASEDHMHINHILETSSGDFIMALDQTVFSDGIL